MAHESEREAALELRAAGTRTAVPPRPAPSARAPSRLVLPIPGGPRKATPPPVRPAPEGAPPWRDRAHAHVRAGHRASGSPWSSANPIRGQANPLFPCRTAQVTARHSARRRATRDTSRPGFRAGEAVDLRASGSIRPYLLAALLDSEEALGRPPGAGRRRRRRRRPRPRPRARRLPGAAPGPLLPVARDRLRVAPGAAAAPGRPAHRRPRRAHRGAGDGDEPPVVVASAVALAEAVPDASLRPAGFALHQRRGGRPRRRRRAAGRGRLRAHRPGRGARPVLDPRRHPRRLRRRPRTGPPGWSCSATRSSRSAGSRPSPSARWARRSGSSSTRRPSSRSSTASWPSSRPTTRRSGPTSPSCCRSTRSARRST